MWGAPSVVCQPTTAQLMTVLAAPHRPPPPLSVRSRGNGITEQRLCWQSPRQHQAQGRPLTFHPPPTSPETWKHRKKARSSRWECLSTRRGNWKWVRSDGEGEKKELGRGKKSRRRKNSECADICAGMQKWKEDIFQFKSMLNESGPSTGWPYAVPGESPINCSHFCPRFNRRTVIIETAAWFHSHWSCHYTDDCRNEAGVDRSGFDVVATTLRLWFISTSETVMGRATLSVFFWVVLSVCDTVASPLSLSLSSPSDFVR